MVIQWYPGHMAKARRMMAESRKMVDAVVELVDARAPRSTSNPDFHALFQGKERIVVLNKSDLANVEMTKQWVAWYKKQGIRALSFVSIGGDKKAVVSAIESAVQERVARMRQKGVTKTVRVMVAGIPNVGKSTFINRIAGAAHAKVGDKPGVTKGKQWVKITPHLELMDTPGLLWPKLDNEVYARRLAFLGSIKDDIMDVEQLASLLLRDLQRLCPAELQARYKLVTPDVEKECLLDMVCRSRGFKLRADEWDYERGARIVLDEFRAGRIARVTLDTPEEETDRTEAEGKEP